eukprot:5412115-Prymnesium_polylepis.1
MDRASVGAGGSRARGRRAMWHGGHVGISRAHSGFFRAAEAGRPGHRQRPRNTRNTFTTRIFTHKPNSAKLGPTGGHRP